MRTFGRDSNVVLIGMPGAGKSTLGVLLAKSLSRQFLDTDVFIQAEEGRRLQAIIDESGRDFFCRLEERYVCMLEVEAHIVATGGSVVYSDAAMTHLRENGFIVHLKLPYALLESRLDDLGSRGVVRGPGQSMEGLYEERIPLYERYADVEMPCANKNHEAIVKDIIAVLPEAMRR